MQDSSQTESEKGVFQRLRPYYAFLFKVKFQFLGGVIASLIFAAASGAGLPLLSRYLFPIIFKDEKGIANIPEPMLQWMKSAFGNNLEESLLICAVIGLPLVMLVRSTAHIISGYLLTFCGLRVSEGIRMMTFSQMQALPLAFFQKYKSGDLLARVMGDTEAIKKVVVNYTNDLVKQPATLFFAIGTIIWLAIQQSNLVFALLAALSAPIIIFPIKRIGKKLSYRSKQIAHENGELSSVLTESLQSPLEIRAYNLQEQHQNTLRSKINRVVELTLKHVKYSLIPSPLIEVVATASLSLSLYYGAKSGMTMGDFMLLGTALYMAYDPAKKLGKIYGSLKSLEAPLDRLEAIMQETNSVPESTNPIELPKDHFSPSISMKDASFAYQTGDHQLSDLNLTIQPGEIVALVGPSGAGKTTFLNLIPRFYDLTKGSLSISGINVKDLKKHDLREQIGLVPQMPTLFNASVKDNIRLGDHNASDEDVIQAAKLAFADEFIQEMDNGYDTIISERGSSVSGGQRQRIAIARAFLKNAPILLLDEATSALDNESEEKITRALDTLMKDKTVLMIAHRQSSLKSATRQLTFESGKIIDDKML